MDHNDFDGTSTYPSPSAYTPHTVVAVVVVPVKYFAIYTEAGVLKTLSLACLAKLNRLR